MCRDPELIAHCPPGHCCHPAQGRVLPRTAPPPHPKPPNLPPSSALTLHAPTAQHEELPASELSLVRRSRPLIPATLTSFLFTS